MTPDDVRQHLAESRDELLGAVAAVSPELWDNLYEWIDFIGGHERRHALQIRRLAGALE